MAGKQYWLQVDGSACGAFGTFYVDLQPEKIGTGIQDFKNKVAVNGFTLYPNPAHDNLSIQSAVPIKNATISIMNITGRTILSKKISSLNPRQQLR